MTVLTDVSVIRVLWILVAIGVPIFSVSFGHFKVGFMHLAPSVFFMGLILYVIVLRFLGFGSIPKDICLPSYGGLALLLAAFVVLHALALLHSAFGQSDWLDIWGTKNMVKIFFGVILFWLTLIFFPRDEKFIGRFFLIAGIAFSCMLAIFIHRYAIVSHMPFLSTDYYGFSRYGKNQAAVQSAFLFFYLFSFFLLAKKRLFIIPFLLITLASILYFQSRMGWAATFLGFMYLICYVWRCNPKMGRGILLKSSLMVLIMGALVLVFISQYIDLSEMSLRVFSMFDPEMLSESQSSVGKHSYQVRGETILMGLKGFFDSPIIGAGLGNTFQYIERPTHNDFATLLIELGILGEIIFLLILWNIWKRGKPPATKDSQEIKWLSMAARSGFVTMLVCLNFFNMYLSPYFWIYLALYIVTVETTDTKKAVVQKA